MLLLLLLLSLWLLLASTVRGFAVVAPFSTTTCALPTRIVWRIAQPPFSSLLHASTPSSPAAPTPVDDNSDNNKPTTCDVVICGGGPAGLLCAILLAQQQRQKQKPNSKCQKPTIRVYDRNLCPPPHPDDDTTWDSKVSKFYLIGLGGRGQAALAAARVWEQVQRRSVTVVGRRDWTPNGPAEGVETIFGNERKVQTVVLPRDKLVGVLYEYIQEHLGDCISIEYGMEVHPVEFDDNNGMARVELSRCVPTKVDPEPDDVQCDVDEAPFQISTNLLIAADGTIRTIANAMEEHDRQRMQTMNPIQKLLFRPFRVKRYADDNQRVYKTFALNVPWRGDLNYSARSQRATFDALPANNKGDYCGVLLLKHDDPMAQANTDPQALRQLLDDYLPQFSKLISDETVAAAAAKPASSLPMFRYAGPRVHQGNHCVLLGDCIHTVKPYFGLGANSALEDAKLFAEYVERDRIPTAVQAFSHHRTPESKTLVRLSRDLDRPGTLGLLTFLLPVILDGIFLKVAPKLFRPNVIKMLQNEALTFRQVARRKRMDRLGQVTILAGLLAGIGWGTNWAMRAVARAIGRPPSVCYQVLIVTMAIASILNKQRGSAKSQ